MIKNLLRLFASSATFIAVMLVANIAIAAPQIEDNSALAIDQSSSSLINLNVISASLDSNNSLLDHLGCSCGICTQGNNPISRDI